MANNEVFLKRIKAYMDDETYPEYAILLRGKWGCGKTFFCKSLISDDCDIWYISAFGVKDTKAIDEKMFEAAHPILSSKIGKGVTGIAYSLFRTACQYRYGIESNDIAEKIAENFKNTEEKIKCRLLIIDDLERAQMPIIELLGYFSSLLYNGTRMIFVANEEEIPQDQKKITIVIKKKSLAKVMKFSLNTKKL